MKSRSMLIAFLLAFVISAAAQRPNITNAKVQESSAAAGLKPAVDALLAQQTGPLWIGYRIPAVPKEGTMCCWNSVDRLPGGNNCCLGCKMNSDSSGTFTGTDFTCSPPEPVPYAFVFLRAEAGKIAQIRVFSADCPLDFGGLPLYWLELVKPGESVALLAALAQTGREDGNYERGLSHQAVMAISFHNIPAADQSLEKLILPNQPLSLRGNVAFWLGVERGKAGLDILRKYAKEDQDERFREKAAFAISQSKEPGAISDLIAMARTDPSPRVRGQAIFWLAQIGGRKEAAQITAAIEDDPATEVKKKAVFALAQMHDGEGVPLLIKVAKENPNPAVRKQAFFWLGQSHDPRALDFLEEILAK